MKYYVKIGQEARDEMLEALSKIASAVGSTLGPGGRPFGYSKIGGDLRLQATMTKDGLTVIRSLGFPDKPAADAVLEYAKQAAAHSVLASGDGTTSTVVLAAAVAEAIFLTQSKLPPQALARKIEKEAQAAIDAIKTETVKSDEMTRLVALTSSNGDHELADIAVAVIEKSSAFGTVVPEKNPSLKERYRIVTQDGYSHCAGYDYNNTFASSASDNASSNSPIEWEKPAIAIFNGSLIAESQVTPVLSAWNELIVSGETRNLVIVCYDLSDAVANHLLVWNRKLAPKNLAIFVVKPRLSSEINSGLQVLRDIAAFSGVLENRIIDGGNYKEMNSGFLGVCDKIRITPSNTVFMGRANNHWIEKRVLQNQNIIADARTQHDKEATALRNSQLTEGLVKVQVGGGMMPDLQERADRLDDAVKAAQACMRNGGLPGCGASYIRAAEIAGVGPELQKALSVIHTQIMSNRGLDAISSFAKGQTVKIHEDGATLGDFQELQVVDSADTVCAVIKNGVDLGVKIATLGGYSFRQGQLSDESLEGI